MKAFSGKEDPIRGYRQLAVKVGVKSAIALVIASGEAIHWSKVAAKKYAKDAMTGFLKDAKNFSKNILATVVPSATPSSSATHTEVP